MSRNEIFKEPGKIFGTPLSRNAKLIYLFFRHKCDETFASVELTRDEIGQKCSLRRNTVALAVNELCAAGLISKKRQGCNLPNFICLDWGGDDEN